MQLPLARACSGANGYLRLGAELPGFGPGAAILLRLRFRVGGIKRVALVFRAMQQVKGDEALDLAKP
jgi:hypothetical protein